MQKEDDEELSKMLKFESLRQLKKQLGEIIKNPDKSEKVLQNYEKIIKQKLESNKQKENFI